MDATALFDEWFRLADKDRDGKIGGGEAVEFFMRSGLTKDTLFQVWNTVAGSSEALNKPQFYSALRLVSLAQQNGGILNEGQARLVLIGTGPVPPPPRLSGLEIPQKEAVRSWAGPVTGPSPPVGSAQPVLGNFPVLSASDYQRYQTMFTQLDTDRDGMVQGGDCYTFFLHWGLPKQILKDVWDVVAGSQGHLTGQQFVQCLYLMDLSKKGTPIPRQLPPGQFPPLQSGPNIVSMTSTGQMSFNMPDYQPAVDVTGSQIHLQPLPAKAAFNTGPTEEYKARGPVFDESRMGDLSAAERSRITSERDQLMLRDQELFNVQKEAEIATRKAKFYKDALAELAMFKSKTDVALLQAEERLNGDKTEAETLQKRYEDAYVGAQKQFEEAMRMRDAVQKARETREQWSAKLMQLQTDIAQLSTMSESLVEKEEESTAELQKQVVEAEAKKSILEKQTDALKEQKAGLETELEGLKGVINKLEMEANESQHELDTLKEQVKNGSDSSVNFLVNLLKSTAKVYQSLVEHAHSVKASIPPEAIITPYHPAADLEFSTLQLSTAANYWDDFKDEGFKLVSALPADTRTSGPLTGAASVDAPTTGMPAPVAAPAIPNPEVETFGFGEPMPSAGSGTSMHSASGTSMHSATSPKPGDAFGGASWTSFN